MDKSLNLAELFERAPGYIAVVRGPDHVFEIANAAYRRLVGRDDLIGKPAREAVPGLDAQGYIDLLDRVRESGEPFSAERAEIDVRPSPEAPPERRLISFIYQPIKDGEGRVAGIFAEGIDVTPAANAEAALGRAERRLAAVLDNASVAVFLMDERQHCAYMNAAAEALTGYALAETQGRPLHDVIHHTRPDGSHFPLAECAIDRAFPERNRMQGEEIFVHKDGSFYPVAFTASPLLDADGKPVGTIVEARGIATEKAAERALREREAHLAGFFNQSAAGMAETDRTGRFVDVNARFAEITGRSREELLGLGMQDITHPEDLPHNLPLFDRLGERGEAFEIEKRYLRPDGSEVWVHNSVTPLRADDGSLKGTLCVTIDITARKRAEEHQRLLVNELNHRVKNSLAIIQGIAHQTFRGRDVPADARRAFEGRLAALAAAHNLLTAESWESASIREVIDDAVAPYRGVPDRFRIAGPDLRLSPKTAVNLALALHELGTNAAKYGALSNAAGLVDIGWAVEGERLRLVWRESDGPPVSPPSQRGFGTRMLERGLAADLGGTLRIDFRRDGVVCTLEAPAAALLQASS